MGRTGRFRLPQPTTDHFAALAESILYQQLAGAAAAAIHRRFVALFDGDLSPEAVLALPEERLRAAGLSRNKATSIRDLAAKVVDGTGLDARIKEAHGLGREGCLPRPG
jgi:DNA-3-methyladenine glycosylase II